MLKYFLIYKETYETVLSKEEFYEKFTYLKYRYINIRRDSGTRLITFHLKNNGFSKSLYYLFAKITFIPSANKSKVNIRYKPNYISIALCFIIALLMGILPAFFVETIIINNQPHSINFNDRLLISTISLLPFGFLAANTFNYFKAENWLKKQLLLTT